MPPSYATLCYYVLCNACALMCYGCAVLRTLLCQCQLLEDDLRLLRVRRRGQHLTQFACGAAATRLAAVQRLAQQAGVDAPKRAHAQKVGAARLQQPCACAGVDGAGPRAMRAQAEGRLQGHVALGMLPAPSARPARLSPSSTRSTATLVCALTSTRAPEQGVPGSSRSSSSRRSRATSRELLPVPNGPWIRQMGGCRAGGAMAAALGMR